MIGVRCNRPLAFTKHGAIHAATILNSPRAVEMSVYVVRAFLNLREVLNTNRELARHFDFERRRVDRRPISPGTQQRILPATA